MLHWAKDPNAFREAYILGSVREAVNEYMILASVMEKKQYKGLASVGESGGEAGILDWSESRVLWLDDGWADI